jgi:hypothetical protein
MTFDPQVSYEKAVVTREPAAVLFDVTCDLAGKNSLCPGRR